MSWGFILLFIGNIGYGNIIFGVEVELLLAQVGRAILLLLSIKTGIILPKRSIQGGELS